MSSLRKVAEIAENSVGKGFCRLIISSDGMTVQFRSRFIFKLLASTIFEEISWFYNERHHGKKPDGRCKWNSEKCGFSKGQVRPDRRQATDDFTKVAGKFVPSVTTEYLPKEAEIKEPKDRDRDSDPRTRYKFLSLKDKLIKETRSQSIFLKRLQMRDHSILNGTGGFVD